MPYGAWHDHGPIRASEWDPANAWVAGFYPSAGGTRPQVGLNTIVGSWRLWQSLAAKGSGQHPGDYSDARTCCLTHAAEYDNGNEFNWDPGECAAIVGDLSAAVSGAGSPDTDPQNWGNDGFAAGTVATYYDADGIPGVAGWYDLASITAEFALYRDTPVSLDPEWLLLNTVPVTVTTQIPGFLEKLDGYDGVHLPQITATRVDGHVKTTVVKTQVRQDAAFTVTTHERPGGGRVPYSGLGGSVLSMSSVTGSSSGVVTITDMAPGDQAYYTVASQRVADGIDPGDDESYVCDGQVAWDSTWWVRVRYWSPQIPLRWKQRDDGLGVGGVLRGKGGTSVQASARGKSYR